MNKKIIISIICILSSMFLFNNNVKALTDSEDVFIDKYSSSFKQYYSIYIDRTTMKANIYGGTTNLNNPTKTIDLNTYPYLIGWTSSYTNYCYSNKPFYYDISSGRFKTGSSFKCSQTNLSEYTASDYNTSASIKSNFDIYNSDGTLYQKATFNMVLIPEINITKYKENIVNKELSSVIYNINFSEYDTTKYKYYYSYDTEEWNEIDKNDYKLWAYTDLTFYVKITDLEDNYITSHTYVITAFDNELPYLTINLDESSIERCTYNINDKTYKTCSNLYIETHITDKNKYSLQIIDPSNNLSWFTFNTIVPSGIYPIFKNGTYQFRIIDNNTKEVIDTDTFVVSSINEEYTELGKYITNECWWDGEESNVSCKYNLYNYDETESTYAYYYSEDNGDTYKKLTKDNLSQIRYVSGVRVYNKKYQKNTYVKFKITTLEDSNDIVGEFSFYINYDDFYQSNSSDPLVYWSYQIKKTITNKFPIINQFNEIYNSIHYTPSKDTPPELTIDLSKLGNNKKVSVIDFKIYEEHREEIFFWMKLSIAFITLFKAYKIIRHDYFRGGN